MAERTDKLKIQVEIDSNPLKKITSQFNETKGAIAELEKEFKAGKVSAEDYNGKLKVLSKSLKGEFNQAVKELRDALRLLELQFKQGKIAGGEFQKQSAVLTQALKAFEDGSGRTASAQNALWHAQNRVTAGSKGLTHELQQIKLLMREGGGSATDGLRSFYREQRVGDRTMREGVQTLQMFSGVLGEGLGGAAAKAAELFQQTEFAVNGLGIAAQSAGGKIGGIGTALLGIAAPLTIAIATFGSLAWHFYSVEKGAAAARKALFDLQVQ